MQDWPTGYLRNELGLLRFASSFLKKLQAASKAVEVITPGQVRLKLGVKTGIADVEELTILAGRAAPTGSLYRPPDWCIEANRWRFQLGFLLRFILAGQPDFTRTVRPPHWKENTAVYRGGGEPLVPEALRTVQQPTRFRRRLATDHGLGGTILIGLAPLARLPDS